VRFKALPQCLIAIILLTGCVSNQSGAITDHDFEVVVRKKGLVMLLIILGLGLVIRS